MNKCCENCYYYKENTRYNDPVISIGIGTCKNIMSRNYNKTVRGDDNKCIFFIDKNYNKNN